MPSIIPTFTLILHNQHQKSKMKIGLGLFLLATFSVFSSFGQKVLSTSEFEKQLKDHKNAQIIDVRTPGEYEKGHLLDAVNIDLKNEGFKQQIKTLDKNKPVFLYCLGGVRSKTASEILDKEGFKEIYDMEGGYAKWDSENKAVKLPVKGKIKGDNFSIAEFEKLVSSSEPVLIDFYAPWCGPCIKMMPSVKKLTSEFSGKITVKTIDYDNNRELVKKMGINAIPVTLIYKNGKVVWKATGYQSEEQLRTAITAQL